MSRTYRNVKDLYFCFRDPTHKPQLVLQSKYIEELRDFGKHPRPRDSKYVVTNWDDLYISGLFEQYIPDK